MGLSNFTMLIHKSYDRQGRNAMDGVLYSVQWRYVIALR